jgi:aryl sulfotransferase
MLVRPPEREYRTWSSDSRRWAHYRPRPDDIVIATYPKSGTTWMQQIVALLVFQTLEPKPIMDISPWIDRRLPRGVGAMIETIEAQHHRRFLKTHLPLDGLPFYSEIKYIHVARDGRDVAMSFHNHLAGFTAGMLDDLDKAGLEDEAIGRPYPKIPADARQFFHEWMRAGAVPGHDEGSPTMSFFHFERIWWEARESPNVLLVHYNDLTADLAGEMRRVADFLKIPVSPTLRPALVDAAGFNSMRRAGDKLMGGMTAIFENGSRGFFFQGTNERWRGVLADADLALYDAKAASMLLPECRRWLAGGRLKSCDPRLA